MTWYDPLFLGTGISPKLNTLKRRISHRTAHVGVFLITLPTCDGRVLEIIPSALLLQRQYPADDLKIIGMAYTRPEALLLTERIISESLRRRGDVDIEAYMRDYFRQGKQTP